MAYGKGSVGKLDAAQRVSNSEEGECPGARPDGASAKELVGLKLTNGGVHTEESHSQEAHGIATGVQGARVPRAARRVGISVGRVVALRSMRSHKLGGRGSSWRALALAAVVALVVHLFTARAEACSCSDSTPEQLYEHADAVFVGEILEGARIPRSELGALLELVFRVRVLEVSKDSGDGLGGEMTIVTAASGTACSPGFSVGEAHVIFANKKAKHGVWWTGTCSGGWPIGSEPHHWRGMVRLPATKERLRALDRAYPKRVQACPRVRSLEDGLSVSEAVFLGDAIASCPGRTGASTTR